MPPMHHNYTSQLPPASILIKTTALPSKVSFRATIKPNPNKNPARTKDEKVNAMATPISFEYHQNAQKTFQPPLIANENAFLGDVFTSEKNDAQAPISAGFYRLEKGEFQ
jgi:hypothetical protein